MIQAQTPPVELFLSLHERFTRLQQEADDLTPQKYVERARELLSRTRCAGKYISAPLDRDILEDMADTLAIEIYERTGELPASALAWPEPAESIAVDSVPDQRPPRQLVFVDRQGELADLDKYLHPGEVTIISGPPGMGKTALAAEAVDRLPGNPPGRDRFPDGIIFHSFYGRPSPADCYETILFALQPDAVAASRAVLRASAERQLRGKRLLLILDGAEAAEDLDAVFAIRAGCAVLVTTRKRMVLPNTNSVDVGSLDEEHALELLRGYELPESDQLVELARELAYMPFALRMAGSSLAETGGNIDAYVRWLRDKPIDAVPGMQSVDRLFRRSLQQLEEAGERHARKLLACFGALAFAPIPIEPVAAALALDLEEVSRACGNMVRYHLLVRPEFEHYQVVHQLVYHYARTSLLLEEQTLARLAGWYEAVATDAESAPTGVSLPAQEVQTQLERLRAYARPQRDRGAPDRPGSLDWSNAKLRKLRDRLAEVYSDPYRIRRLAAQADIAVGTSPQLPDIFDLGDLWTELMEVMHRQGKLRTMIAIAAHDPENREQRAYFESYLGNGEPA